MPWPLDSCGCTVSSSSGSFETSDGIALWWRNSNPWRRGGAAQGSFRNTEPGQVEASEGAVRSRALRLGGLPLAASASTDLSPASSSSRLDDDF
jgi:hypothetical protein